MFFRLADGSGSAIAVTDRDGTQGVQYTYAPFGETASTDAVFPNPFQFTGRENDGIAGLYYYRTRYYHPGLHRFIGEDGLSFAGGDVNLYAYVRNVPTTLRDPRGLATFGFGGTLQVGLLGRVAAYLQGAIVLDTKGNVALTVTRLSSGKALGFEGVTTCIVCGSGRGAVQFSPDAEDVMALAGPFETWAAGYGVAPGVQATAEIDTSPTTNVFSVGAAIGGGYPAMRYSATKVTTTTVVDVQFNIVDVVRRAVTFNPLGDIGYRLAMVLGRRK